MENKPVFVAMSLGGISNRLKIIASCQRMVDKYDGKMSIYWPETKTCYAKFADLFKTDKFKEIKKEELREILNQKDTKIYEDNVFLINKPSKKNNVFPGWRFILLSDFDKIKYEDGIDLKFSGIDNNLKEEFVSYLNNIQPTKEIQDKIDLFLKENKLSEFIGLHIRRGDFLEGVEGLGKVSSDDSFVNEINNCINSNSKAKFFLCTDSKEVEDMLKNKFPKRIISFSKSSFDKFDKEFVKDGLIDLLLLSKTKKILGTYRSTFTELAWWLGSCKAEVKIPMSKELLEKYEKNMKKNNSVLVKIKRKLYNLIKPRRKTLEI